MCNTLTKTVLLHAECPPECIAAGDTCRDSTECCPELKAGCVDSICLDCAASGDSCGMGSPCCDSNTICTGTISTCQTCVNSGEACGHDGAAACCDVDATCAVGFCLKCTEGGGSCGGSTSNHNACCPGGECVEGKCQVTEGDGGTCPPVVSSGKVCIDAGGGGNAGDGHVTVNVIVNNIAANATAGSGMH